MAILTRRLPVYWRLYPIRACVNALTILFLVWLIYRTVVAIEKGGLIEAADPITVGLATLIALLAGTHVAQSLRSGVPIEQDEDRSIEPWRKINHSFSDLRWTTLTDASSSRLVPIKTFLRANSSPLFRLASLVDFGGKTYEKLLEDTATENYRIVSFVWPSLFVRLYREADEVRTNFDIEVRKRLPKYLISHSLNPGRRWYQRARLLFGRKYSRGLVPLRVRDGYNLVDIGNGQRVRCQWFRYIDADAHYCGNPEQIKSFSRKLGGLFGLLTQLNRETANQASEDCEFFRTATRKLLSPDEIGSRWEAIKEPIREVLESNESDMIPCWAHDSHRSAPCGPPSIAALRTVTACVIRAI